MMSCCVVMSAPRTLSGSVAGGAVPAGLSLAPDGAITGTPSVAGTATFTVEVTSAGQTAQRLLSITVIPTLVLTTTSLPLATVGVIFALDLLDWPVSVVVLLGAILLAGIVVNNAILLIDAINRRRREGLERTEAIVEACSLRLRPILMTTATTVLGLVPLTGALGALSESLPFSLGGGEGTELRAPMAVTVIAGLITSSALTLLVIPAVYSLVDRMSVRTRLLFASTSKSR